MNRIIYNVMVQASPKLRTGEAVFSVRLKEGRGNGTEEEPLRLKLSVVTNEILSDERIKQPYWKEDE